MSDTKKENELVKVRGVTEEQLKELYHTDDYGDSYLVLEEVIAACQDMYIEAENK